MSRAVIRTGLIGFGVAGRLFHAPFLRALDDYSLDIVVTSDAARAAEVERCHPGARVVPTPERFLGVTYKDDVAGVRDELARLVDAGVYPSPLWD